MIRLTAYDLRAYIPDAVVLRDTQERHDYRYAGDIPSPQVQNPGNIAQIRQHMHVRARFPHLLPDPGQFAFRTLSAPAFVQDPYRRRRNTRAVFPDLPDQIPVCGQFRAFSSGCFRQARRPGSSHGTSVKSKTSVLVQPGFHPGSRLRHSRLAHPEQPDPAPSQLTLRLDKIPAVRPQARVCQRNHRRTGRPGKSGYIFPRPVVSTDIFRLMTVGGRDHIDTDPCLFHLLSQFPQLLPFHFPLSSLPPVQSQRAFRNAPYPR